MSERRVGLTLGGRIGIVADPWVWLLKEVVQQLFNSTDNRPGALARILKSAAEGRRIVIKRRRILPPVLWSATICRRRRLCQGRLVTRDSGTINARFAGHTHMDDFRVIRHEGKPVYFTKVAPAWPTFAGLLSVLRAGTTFAHSRASWNRFFSQR